MAILHFQFYIFNSDALGAIGAHDRENIRRPKVASRSEVARAVPGKAEGEEHREFEKFWKHRDEG